MKHILTVLAFLLMLLSWAVIPAASTFERAGILVGGGLICAVLSISWGRRE